MTTLAEDLGAVMTAESPRKPAAPTAGAGSSPSVQLLALALLDDNPANRGGEPVGDVADLAESIDELGLLEPLTVTPAGERFVIQSGHRRRKALLQLGHAAAWCNVREDLVDEKAIAARIVANLQREDLTPLQEAADFKQLADLGHSQRDIARLVTKSQSYVNKRLSLLELPAAVVDAVLENVVTIEEARALRPIADAPEELSRVIADRRRGMRQSVEVMVASAVDRIDRRTQISELKDLVETRGDRWMEEVSYSNIISEYPLKSRTTPAKHRKLDCHAYGVHSYGKPKLIEVCLRPNSHKSEPPPAPKGGSFAEPATETAAQKKNRLAEERLREKAEAARLEQERLAAERLATLTAALSAKPSVKGNAALMDLVIEGLFEDLKLNADLLDEPTLALVGVDANEDELGDAYLAAHGQLGKFRLLAAYVVRLHESHPFPRDAFDAWQSTIGLQP
ncbi:MAG: chromosome segregation DNA-binding protein [Frankiales bacterium]|nr:chromosome segregation DNA-binding protein [Frankiales bacterium]